MRRKMNILHIIRTSLKYYVSGYTIRSNYILKYQKEFANVFVSTTISHDTDKTTEIVDNIPYFRINEKISKFLGLNAILVTEWGIAFGEVFLGMTKDDDQVLSFIKTINTAFGAVALTLALIQDLSMGFFNMFKTRFVITLSY